MSEAHPPIPGQAQPTPGGADPSMEDILASIRRILSEDESEPAASTVLSEQPAKASHDHERDDVLDLDASMIVEDPVGWSSPSEPATDGAPPPAASEPPPSQASPMSVTEPVMTNPPSVEHREPLVAPEVAAAAASSVGALLRRVVAGREQVAVHRGGPTIEDMVREEIRPLLKQWLDVNLPPLVERLVRAEMERVVGRVS
jgi:hypothetical protein